MIKMKKNPGLIVLGVVLLTMGVFQVKTLSAAQPENSPGQQEQINRPKVEYKAQGLRDPFQPLLTEQKVNNVAVPQEEKPLPNFTVQGVVWGGVFPQAIINDKIVKIGDMLGEAKILEIDKKGITVLFANKEYVLSPSVATGQQPSGK